MNTAENTAYTTADAVAKELANAGVDIIFGIVSIHNMPIYDAIVRQGAIKMVAARGESGAVNMADAYARASGKLGVVITSTGAGAGNAAGALTESWNKGTPLLHITGEVALDYIGTSKRFIHECKDQQAMMEGASKKAHLLKQPEEAVTCIRQAITEANTAPQGPITVTIPTDLQTMIIPENTILAPKSEAKSQPPMPEAIIESIAQAKRPVIWAGGGVIASEASEELKALAEKLQPAVITSESGKGAIPENHPLCIGNFTATPQVKQLLEKADLLISIGTRFRAEETYDWTMPMPDNHININADPTAINRNYCPSEGIVADAKLVLQQLNHQLTEKTLERKTAYTEEIQSVKDAVRQELRHAVAPYDEFANHMRSVLPEDSILVRDVTIPGYLWANRLVDMYQPRTSIYASGGGIGQGLPMAIGAQLADKNRRTVLVAGDGGFMVNIGEMAVASEEELPLIVLLFDDGGYGILRYLQSAAYGRLAKVNLKNPDYIKIGEAMGFAAEKVGSADAFKQALETAMANKQPSLIVIDMDAVGPMNVPYEESADYIASFRPNQS